MTVRLPWLQLLSGLKEKKKMRRTRKEEENDSIATRCREADNERWNDEWQKTQRKKEWEEKSKKKPGVSITITITRGQECAFSEKHISSSERTINNYRASHYKTTWNKLWPTSRGVGMQGMMGLMRMIFFLSGECRHLHLLVFMKSHTDGDVLLDGDVCWRRLTHLSMRFWEALVGRKAANSFFYLSDYIDLRPRAYAENRCRPLPLSTLPALCHLHAHMPLTASVEIGWVIDMSSKWI